MDTGMDFITAEFLNILFFQQKSLVIFPYVDLKHLHTLDIFTAGYNPLDIESTALENVREIIEAEVVNSYSENPTFFFIYNVSSEKISLIKDILKIENVHCVINTNERDKKVISDELMQFNNANFIYYNKKRREFLNFNGEAGNLEFEKTLISNSLKNKAILNDKVQEIKSKSTRIFVELNETGNLDKIGEILSDYDKKYWNKILKFTELYHNTVIPDLDLDNIKSKPREEYIRREESFHRIDDKDFYFEIELILDKKSIQKEFLKLLNDFKNNKEEVSKHNLNLKELFSPKVMYNYLRNRHWTKDAPERFENFLISWVDALKVKQNPVSGWRNDLREVFTKLKFPIVVVDYLLSEDDDIDVEKGDVSLIEKIQENIIPDIDDFGAYKEYFLKRFDKLDRLLGIGEK